jgi:hypothetical protein
MTITIHTPHYGYDYPSTAVILKCIVVGKLVANNNETIQGIAYELDGGAPSTVTIPPKFEYGFALDGALGGHQLSILVFDNVNGLTSQSFNFTAVTGNAYPKTTPDYKKNAPNYTAHVTDQGHQIVGVRVKHTYRIDVTPANQGQILSVGILSSFQTENDYTQSTFLYVPRHDDPQLRSFSMKHLNEEGTVILSVLMWDPNDMHQGVLIENVVASRREALAWAPPGQSGRIKSE